MPTPDLPLITSARNPRVQWVRALQARARARRKDNAFVVEGVRLVEEAAAADWPVRLVLYTEELSDRGRAALARLRRRAQEVRPVAPHVMQAASDTRTPQGILAVLPLPDRPLPAPQALSLILDGVRDPGNLGTILRTAAAAGVDTVLLTPGSADPYAPKVVRAAMGAHFRLPIHSLSWDAIRHWLKQPGAGRAPHLVLAAAHEGIPYTQADFHAPTALVIGGEAEGAGTPARGLAEVIVHIPMPGGGESLNAATAAGILLFEIVRQRGKQARV